MARPTIVAGNWKHHPSRDSGRKLYDEIRAEVARRQLPDSIQVHVFPPYPYLALLEPDENVRVGAQDLSDRPWGAFTGEVGAALLAEFGVRHVIIGHSERRHVFGESNELIARKVVAAQEAGLVPVLCVGETETERDEKRTFAVLEEQLDAVEDGITQGMIVAYEPVWAIGTGRTATPEQAVEAHRFIRDRVRQRIDGETADELVILYGGSVKPGNALELLSENEIDGALIGGASLEAESFLGIVTAAQQAAK